MQETKEPEKTPLLKKILLTVGFILVIAIIVNSMHESYIYVKPAKDENASWVTIPASIASLENDFSKNPDSATAKYKEKSLLVTGSIKEIDKYHSGDSYIIFQSADPTKKVEIECIFKNEKNMDSLQKGTTVTIKGNPEYKPGKLYLQKSEVSK